MPRKKSPSSESASDGANARSASGKKAPSKSSVSTSGSKKKPLVLTPEVLGKETSAPPKKSARPSRYEEDEEILETGDEETEDRETEDGEPEPSDESESDSESSENLPATLDKEMRAVSPTDPLKRYMEELKQYPLLEPEEEIALVRRMLDKGDAEAARRLVQANLRLVVKIAFEYRSVYANIMDLIQEGNVGLMKAVSKFDPTKGARLGYYSSWWIRSYILKYLLDNFRLVKIGTTQAQKKLFFHLMREKEKLEAQGILAGPKLLADKLHVREKDVVEMEKRLGPTGGEVSLDTPVQPGGEKKTSFVEFLQDGQEAADEKLARGEMLDVLRGRLPQFRQTLNEKERRLLEDRLLAEEPKTLQEVADLYGLTRERARQIEAKVIEKLREFLKEELK